MMKRPTMMLLVGALMASSVPALSQEQPATEQVATQFYLLSFSDAPVTEVADAVIGGSLGQTFTVDPAVVGTMNFRIEGALTEDALLQEFGTALMDQDVVLIRMRDRSLVIAPRENLALNVAKGGAMIALPRPGVAPSRPTSTTPAPETDRIVYGQDRWWDGAIGGLLLFLAGAASGAAALLGGQWMWRRRTSVIVAEPLLRLEMSFTPPLREDAALDDLDLVIPTFEQPPLRPQ